MAGCIDCAMSHEEPRCGGRVGEEQYVYWYAVRLGSSAIAKIAGDMLRARLARERHGIDDTKIRAELIEKACSLGMPFPLTPKDVPTFTHTVIEKDGTERPETPEEKAEREAHHAELRKKLFNINPPAASASDQPPDQSSTPPP